MGKGALLAAMCVLVLVATMAAPVTAVSDTTLPAPISPTASVEGSTVNITWRAPTTSAGTINQTGCDSSFVMFTAINKSFATEYPSIEVVLKGGGNNIAFSEWIAHHSDVAMASRKISADEMQRAQAAGLNVTEIKMAVESIAVVVNKNVGVTELTADQVKALFDGSTTNWKELGGADVAVKPIVPGPGGPPYLFFNNSLMVGSSFAPSVQFVKDSLSCADTVANTTGGIGIMRTGYLNRTSGIQALSLRSSPGDPAISPLDYPAAYNSTYRLSRNYYLYTNGAPNGAIGMWADYALSRDRGQRIASENGFLPLTANDLNASRAMINSTSDIPITGYKVYRTDPDGSNRTFLTSSTEFVDTNVTAGKSYSYRVSAVYATGEGNLTKPLSVKIASSNDAPSGGASSPSNPPDYTLPVLVIIGSVVVIAIAIILGRKK